MNPFWFGDSFDIVKRFFISALHENGYSVYVDPMFTGDWQGAEPQFFDFLGAEPISKCKKSENASALFIDPDTGIAQKASLKHITLESLVEKLEKHKIVFSFDQSFSRNKNPIVQMKEKLRILEKIGGFGFYYNSHAKFLFIAKDKNQLSLFKLKLVEIGLPIKRFIGHV